jgi:mRNA-degrading endonuclease RelE of RelBE toxin-antitoxin system
MRYEIVLSPQAVADLRRLEAPTRAGVREAMEVHLRHEPTKVSKSRIKRLRGLAHPEFRLRVGEVRVFYDVTGSEVYILAVLLKSMVDRWLQEAGEPE